MIARIIIALNTWIEFVRRIFINAGVYVTLVGYVPKFGRHFDVEMARKFWPISKAFICIFVKSYIRLLAARCKKNIHEFIPQLDAKNLLGSPRRRALVDKTAPHE